MFESSDQSCWKHSEINASFPSNTKAHLEIRTKSKTRGNRDFFSRAFEICSIMHNAYECENGIFEIKLYQGGKLVKAKKPINLERKAKYLNNSRKLKVSESSN